MLLDEFIHWMYDRELEEEMFFCCMTMIVLKHASGISVLFVRIPWKFPKKNEFQLVLNQIEEYGQWNMFLGLISMCKSPRKRAALSRAYSGALGVISCIKHLFVKSQSNINAWAMPSR